MEPLVTHSALLQPLIALVLWSFVMWAWLYATRIPAMNRLKITYDPHRPGSEFVDKFPGPVRWKADNYNHLMEQPTLFYAVVLALALLGQDDGLNVALAWGYVGLRVVHSLVQAIWNAVLIRFGVFMVSSVLLLVMTIRAAIAAF